LSESTTTQGVMGLTPNTIHVYIVVEHETWKQENTTQETLLMMSSMGERPKSLHLLVRRDTAHAFLKSDKNTKLEVVLLDPHTKHEGRCLRECNELRNFNSRNLHWL
jgi:hypothetical protein